MYHENNIVLHAAFIFQLYYCWDSFHFRLKKQATGAEKNAAVMSKYEISENGRSPKLLEYSSTSALTQEMQEWFYVN